MSSELSRYENFPISNIDIKRHGRMRHSYFLLRRPWFNFWS